MEQYERNLHIDSVVKLARMNGNILLNEVDNSLLYHINSNHNGTYSIFTTSKHDSKPQFAYNDLSVYDVNEFVCRLTA